MNVREFDVRYLAPPSGLTFPSPFACVSPAGIEGTAWDSLPALHAGESRQLSLAQLCALVGVPKSSLDAWLGDLEDGALITGTARGTTESSWRRWHRPAERCRTSISGPPASCRTALSDKYQAID